MAYTRVSEHFFAWEQLLRLSVPGRHLLLFLYAGPLAKRWLPGILVAGDVTVAESARLGALETIELLREMEDKDVIERDRQRHVIRLTQLPDKGERPANGKVVRMFWNRWRDLPESPLRVRHLPTLKWLSEPYRTPKLQEVWDETFGSIVPIVSNQPQSEGSLWTSPQTTIFEEDDDTVSKRYPDTVRQRSGYGNGIGNGIGNEKGGAGGNGKGKLPHSQPFSVEELLGAVTELAGGRIAADILDPRVGDELWRLVEICGETDVTLDDARLAGEFIGAGYLSYRSDLDAKWLAKSGSLLGTVSKARQWVDEGRPPPNGAKSGRRGPTSADYAARARQLKAQGL